MAELATIARPYAEALFKAVSPAEGAAVADQVEALALVGANPSLLEFAANPKTTSAQVFDLIVSLVEQPAPGDAARNLLRAVIDNGRLAALGEIAAQYRALVNARGGIKEALVQSAFPIESAQLAEVVATLEQRFGSKLALHLEVDPSLIGGIRVVVGDEVFDSSVKSHLQRMKAALTG